MSEAEAAQLKAQIRAATDPRDKERLQVVLWATRGQHTLDDLARLAGRARSTIQVWLDAFTEGGLTRLLERAAPPGKSSPVAEAKVQAQLQAGLKAGRWRTAGQVAAWLKEAHGIERAAKSLYYWLGKVWTTPLTRDTSVFQAEGLGVLTTIGGSIYRILGPKTLKIGTLGHSYYF